MNVFLLVSTVGGPVGDHQPGWSAWWWLIPIGLYLLHVVMWPMRRCWACSGTGKLRAPLGLAYRPCDGCGGSGERHRWGLFRQR